MDILTFFIIFHNYSHSLTVHNIHQMHITIYAYKQTFIKWLFKKNIGANKIPP